MSRKNLRGGPPRFPIVKGSSAFPENFRYIKKSAGYGSGRICSRKALDSAQGDFHDGNRSAVVYSLGTELPQRKFCS
jgi:hypothetical protein